MHESSAATTDLKFLSSLSVTLLVIFCLDPQRTRERVNCSSEQQSKSPKKPFLDAWELLRQESKRWRAAYEQFSGQDPLLCSGDFARALRVSQHYHLLQLALDLSDHTYLIKHTNHEARLSSAGDSPSTLTSTHPDWRCRAVDSEFCGMGRCNSDSQCTEP